jgi:hypothetical protein
MTYFAPVDSAGVCAEGDLAGAAPLFSGSGVPVFAVRLATWRLCDAT